MGSWVTYAIFGYVLSQFVIAATASRFIKTETDFLLAGRNLGIMLASISLFATWFGAETVIGSSGAVASGGLSAGRADPFGYTICLIVMGIFLAYKMRSRNYVTLGDYFRERFGTAAEKLAALVMIPTSLIWASAQILAFASVLTVVTSVPLTMTLVFCIGIVIVYSSLGGMIADVVTDVVQGAVIVISLVLLLWFVILKAGGPGAALSAIEPDRLRILSNQESLWAQLDGWMIPILGSLVAQEAMGRLLSTRTPEIARRACLQGAGIYLIIGLMPVLIGLIGYNLVTGIKEQDAFLPSLAITVMPSAMYVIFLGGVISAILSTINSALLAVTALAGHNIITPLFPAITEKKKLLLDRCIVAIAGVFCYFMAMSGESIYGLVEMASSFGSGGLVICVLVGLYSGFGGRAAALATLLSGVVFTLLADYVLELEAPYLSAVGGCLVVYLCVAFWERKRSQLITQKA